MTTMLRVSAETRDRVQRLAEEEFGGASADETVRRLLDEHWEMRAIAAVEAFARDDPEGWETYLADAAATAAADAPVVDGWDEAA
jgi:hypothetical protein